MRFAALLLSGLLPLVASQSIVPSQLPSEVPSTLPSKFPSRKPSTTPSSKPSRKPSSKPSTTASTKPSSKPSGIPKSAPSALPSGAPTPFDPIPGFIKAMKSGRKAVKWCCKGTKQTKKKEKRCFRNKRKSAIKRGKLKGFFINAFTKANYVAKYDRTVKKTKTMAMKGKCLTPP